MRRLRPGEEQAPQARRPSSSAWPFVILLVSVGLLCGPLLTHEALPLGSDVYSTAHYLQGFRKALGEGELLPRWTDRSNQDLGAPSFVMLAPLAYYGAAACAWAAGSVPGGFRLFLVLVAALTAAAFYLLARDWIGPGVPAALSAGLYLLLPYHVLDMYQRFALSETAAFIFLPLLLMLGRRLAGGPGRLSAAGLGLVYAALIGTHLITAFLASLILIPWLLWEARTSAWSLARLAGSLASGLLIASPFLLPALLEKQHANQSWLREMPNGDYRINFIHKDPLLPGLGIKDPVKLPVRRSAHAQLALGALAAAVALASRQAPGSRRRRDVLALAGLCAISFLLQVEVSDPIYRVVPELPTIQFPWRFQTLMVLSASLLFAFALEAGWGRAGPDRSAAPAGRLWGAVALTAMVAINLSLAWSHAHLKPFGFTREVSDNDGVTYWIEPAFTPVQFTRFREFKRMEVQMPKAAYASGEGSVEVLEWTSSRIRLQTQSEAPGVVAVRSFWFPGWAGRLDDRPIDLLPLAPLAVKSFQAPAGRHVAELTFEPTASRRAGAWAGAAGLVLAALLAGLPRGRAAGEPASSARAAGPR